MNTVHIPETETSESLTMNRPELGQSRALESVERVHGCWLLVAGAVRGTTPRCS